MLTVRPTTSFSAKVQRFTSKHSGIKRFATIPVNSYAVAKTKTSAVTKAIKTGIHVSTNYLMARFNALRLNLSPTTREFISRLRQDKDVPPKTLGIVLNSLSRDNVELYKRIYEEKMPDGSKRVPAFIFKEVANHLAAGGDYVKTIYNAVDDFGKARFSGVELIDKLNMFAGEEFKKAALKDKKISRKTNDKILRRVKKYLDLRTPDGRLLTGEQICFLGALEKFMKGFDAEKILHAKDLKKDFSPRQRIDLLYAIDEVKRQNANLVNHFSKEGITIKLYDFRRINLPFLRVNSHGAFDNSELLALIKEDNNKLIKVKKIKDPELLKTFSEGMIDLEKALSSRNADVSNIKAIRLKYSRANFISDAQKASLGLTEEEASEFTRAFGFELKDNDLLKYPTTAIPSEISKISNPKVKLAVEHFNSNVERFTTGNKISIPEFPELEKALDKITKVFPEFYTTIGKKQHDAHSYTLDIHMLKTLQETIMDPRWNNLTEKDKELARIAILLHDISKIEGEIDKMHPILSAEDVSLILNKLNLSGFEIDRIAGLIKNHHWLEEINKKMTPDQARTLAQMLAFEFRRSNDWQISQIFTLADLKSTSKKVYDAFKGVLEHPIVNQISKKVDRIQSSAIIMPITKIPTASQLRNIETTTIQSQAGITRNKIIYINDKTDLEAIGFAPGTTPDKFRGIVHTIAPERENSLTLFKLITNSEETFLSASYVSKDMIRTFSNVDQKSNQLKDSPVEGLLLDVENSNIAAAYPIDILAGFKKDLNTCLGYFFPENQRPDQILKDISKFRNHISSLIKNTLKISNEEYIRLFKQISKYNSFDEIKNPKVKEAILKATDSLLDYKSVPQNLYHIYGWSEIVACQPRAQAILAKNCKPADISYEMRKFAQDNDLPIVILE